MPTTDRRTLLRMMGAGAAATTLTRSIDRALAIPAHHRTGTIADVEHIVILMQENRSFDHYLGTLRGVRGFADPRAVTLADGRSVWHQPDGKGGVVLPFRPDAPDLGLVFLEDLAHDWATTHAAWNGGEHDGWVPAKGATTMAHLTRADIPFHYALADAFTVCDAYHCSLFGPTDPNRYHMFTGWVGNDGAGGGPVIDNAEAGYGWSTFPERLEEAGISWKVYQDVGAGLDAAHFWGWGEDAYIGNYGDNSLLYFRQYQDAPAASPLALKARTGTQVVQGGTLFDIFRADIAAGTLPQVSWIAAPEAFTEHPNWPANYGAWYISQILDALTANPEIWSRTALFVVYDENDGFFDHMVPPTPPRSPADGLSTVATTNEIFPGDADYASGPYGLGLRVPAFVISPWSRGGFVNSQVFDHTSLIRFIEQRFGATHPGVFESNITPWRRAVAGDLTSAFDFRHPNRSVPSLPTTAGYVPPDADRHPDYKPVPPTTQALPAQEKGVRFARALPYQLHATATVDAAAGRVGIVFENTGAAAAVFHIRSADGQAPRSTTVGAGTQIADTWPLAADGSYDLSVHGPNGFLRHFQGRVTASGATAIAVGGGPDGEGCAMALRLTNGADAATVAVVTNLTTGETLRQTLAPGETVTRWVPLERLFGWYDLAVTAEGDPAFRQHLAGHVETGRDSISDPLMGGLLAPSR